MHPHRVEVDDGFSLNPFSTCMSCTDAFFAAGDRRGWAHMNLQVSTGTALTPTDPYCTSDSTSVRVVKKSDPTRLTQAQLRPHSARVC